MTWGVGSAVCALAKIGSDSNRNETRSNEEKLSRDMCESPLDTRSGAFGTCVRRSNLNTDEMDLGLVICNSERDLRFCRSLGSIRILSDCAILLCSTPA